MTIAIVLLGYAALVAVLAPCVLNRDWVRRSPRLALLLWHASALSILVTMVLAGVRCVIAPGPVQACIAALSGSTGTADAVTVAANLLVPVLLLTRLAVVAMRAAWASRADRRRHLELLGVLGRPVPDLGVTVIPGAAAAAYCVPGTDRIVLTRAALDSLDPAALAAVLTHERAHLAGGRHQLLVDWAGVLPKTVPAVPLFTGLLRATRELVELLADDHAVGRGARAGLADAIMAFALAPSPETLSVSGGPVLARVQRLLEPPPPLPVGIRLGGTGAEASLVALPAVLALVPVVAACPMLSG